jgi:hypothetical protein
MSKTLFRVARHLTEPNYSEGQDLKDEGGGAELEEMHGMMCSPLRGEVKWGNFKFSAQFGLLVVDDKLLRGVAPG